MGFEDAEAKVVHMIRAWATKWRVRRAIRLQARRKHSNLCAWICVYYLLTCF